MEITSSRQTQKTCIRQGCPLSPYLFLVIRTVLLNDIHSEDEGRMIQHRLPIACFDEVVYADDTIVVSTDTKTPNRYLEKIERHGKRFGLQLNKGKCEVIANVLNAAVKFSDGSMVKRCNEVKYLGCHISARADSLTEINKRIGMCMGIMKQLDLFWLHSNCPDKFKIQVFNSILRSKVLYGIESANLPDAIQNKLNVFQLKGLRKILGMKTTYIERANTNEQVIRTASAAIRKGNEPKTRNPSNCSEILMRRPELKKRETYTNADPNRSDLVYDYLPKTSDRYLP